MSITKKTLQAYKKYGVATAHKVLKQEEETQKRVEDNIKRVIAIRKSRKLVEKHETTKR